MERKEQTNNPSKSPTGRSGLVKEHAPTRYDTIIKNYAPKDGRLFYSKDRATFTFLDKDEVVSLHLDARKANLFYKGHRLVGAEDLTELTDYLTRLKRALVENPDTHRLLPAFEAVITRLETIK